MAQDADHIVDDEIKPATPGKVDSHAKSGDESFFEKESSKMWNSVPASSGVAPKLLTVGVVIAILMIVRQRRNALAQEVMHEKSLA